MRRSRLSLCTLVLVLISVLAPADAAAKKNSPKDQGPGAVYGFGIGALLPQESLDDSNDPGYFIQTRSLFVEKVFGGRAAAYYGDTVGSNGTNGGRVYGFDFDVLVKFGSASTFGYVFGGLGYGNLTFTVPGPLPGSTIRNGTHDWCWTAGIGLTITRKVYIEASYVWYQTHPEKTEFIPVVIGYQF